MVNALWVWMTATLLANSYTDKIRMSRAGLLCIVHVRPFIYQPIICCRRIESALLTLILRSRMLEPIRDTMWNALIGLSWLNLPGISLPPLNISLHVDTVQ